MANQAITFGLIGAGGLLLTAAVTNSSLAETIQGHAHKLSGTSSLDTFLGGLKGGNGAVGSTGAMISGLGAGTAGTIAKTAGTGKFSAAQKQFASRLASDSGLDVNVILAWMQNEQPPGSASAPNGRNNWLNIGATDSVFYGGSNPAWTDPVTAADETYKWLSGHGIQDYGPPSAGIVGILATAGQPAGAQIAAIQGSGWASGGETAMREIYQELTGKAAG